MASASGASSSHKRKIFLNTIFLSYDPNELCDRIKLLLQEKQARNNFNLISEEVVAIADETSE